jgi:hypothetical protein
MASPPSSIEGVEMKRPSSAVQLRSWRAVAWALALLGSPVPVLAASTAPPDAPDLTGKWAMRAPARKLLTTEGKPPPLNAAGAKLYAERQAKLKADPRTDPVSECLMHGVPRLSYASYPFLILQTRRALALVHEVNHTFRTIYWDDPLPEDWSPTWLGHSSARFEGKTLVIDTEGMNAETWLDYSGLPHGQRLKVQERLTLSDPATIRGEVVITDPDFYSRPWRASFTLDKQPGMTLAENVCQDTHQM